MDKQRLMASLKAAESGGPLASQDILWNETADRYNTGNGLPKEFPATPDTSITKSIVYHFVYRNGIVVKTPKRKAGRPSGGNTMCGKSTYKEIIKRILDYLQEESVEQKWQKSDVRDWAVINDARRILGMQRVEPIDNPTLEYFN